MADGDEAEVLSCEGVLYVKVKGCFSRPPVALMEGYDLKYGDWKYIPKSNKEAGESEQVSYFFPMDAEMVRLWNNKNKGNTELRFVRYQPGVRTEEEMQAEVCTRVAKGQVGGYGPLFNHIQESALRKNWTHYSLKPISVPLEMFDALSAIPLTGAALGVAVVGAPVFVVATELGRQMQTPPKTEQASPPPATAP